MSDRKLQIKITSKYKQNVTRINNLKSKLQHSSPSRLKGKVHNNQQLFFFN